MIQEVMDCEKKMLDMQKEEKIESDAKVILDELKTISVGHSV
jgi:hypothetical protein